ncbi:MAG: hypothetical protein E7593_00835 [Ruminococcaceae bacterium]|nr:hypothetical protein [Oscillospiraceae bacterium]
MAKKIIKITLSAIAAFAFILSIVKTALDFSYIPICNKIMLNGMSIPTYSTTVLKTQNASQGPYSYINLQKIDYSPLAMSIYDQYKNENQQGQDSTPIAPPSNEPLPEGVYPISSIDMSEQQTIENLIYKNESKYSPDINNLIKQEYPLKYSKQASTNNDASPLVLIIHTHGTECYMPENSATYTADTPTRTTDINNNVVAVGRAFADTLNNNGIPTIHCETMFDAQSYSESYNLSEAAVMEYIKKYPSIQYVFDIHRDSIVKTNMEKLKPVTTINNESVAQAMLVVGTNSSGANHPNWMNNLTVASYFQYSLIEKYNTLMRPINLRSASFNAEHAPGSILIEIGSCGNTLSEAKRCAVLLANTISEVILSDGIR